MKKFVLFSVVSLISTQVFAGGSISKEEVLERVCNVSQSVCGSLENLRLNNTGSALRDPEGNRVAPYEFDTKLGAHVVITFSAELKAYKLEVTDIVRK